jgi:tetratricopeptide (TPR) repeat protein
MDPRQPTGAVRLLLAAALATAALHPVDAAQKTPAVSEICDQALELAYNLDHDQALVLLRRAVALAPDDPAPHRALASVLWLNILFRRGAVTVDHYLGAFSRSSVDLPKPPPEIDAEFRAHVQRAVSLGEQRVSANSSDAQARYDLGAALGLEASYIATVEGRMLAGFRAARRSYDQHEQVLALDGSRRDAGLIVGTYRYVISTLGLPMRVMAYVVGFGGGRQRGIQMLEDAAHYERVSGGTRNDARTEAMFALILVYNREGRYDDAMRVLQDLRRLYPRNRLLLLEEGATALRGGKAQEAQNLLTEGLAMFASDRRAHIPGEEALWRYKRGAARAALGRGDAVEDLERATASDAQPWVGGRAQVALGRLAVARGDRTSAAAKAREAELLCRRGNDPVCIDEARALLRRSSGG